MARTKKTQSIETEDQITLSLSTFDPTEAELNKMVAVTKNITVTDLKDKEQMELVTSNRIALKKARVAIEKAGKSFRDPANAFLKKVLEKEHALVAIIEPEEERLAAIEQEAKELQIKEERLEKLPVRRERLLAIDDDLGAYNTATDEELLGMDSEQFEAYFNEQVAQHNYDHQQAIAKLQQEEKEKMEAEKRRIEEERAKIEREKQELEHQKELAATEARAKEEARVAHEKAAQEAKIKAEEEEKRLADQKAAEQKKLAKRAEFIKWRESLGYTPETAGEFKLIETETGYDLYRKLGSFKK